jgi:hypothetical protein
MYSEKNSSEVVAAVDPTAVIGTSVTPSARPARAASGRLIPLRFTRVLPFVVA